MLPLITFLRPSKKEYSMTLISKFKRLLLKRTVIIAATALMITLSGCQNDSDPRNDPTPSTDSGAPSVLDPSTPANGTGDGAGGDTSDGTGNAPDDVTAGGGNGGNTNNPQFRIELSATQFSLVEGATTANLNINVVRTNGHSSPVSLALSGDGAGSAVNMRWQFSDEIIEANETTSNLQIQLGVGRAAIQPQQRELLILANDGNSSSLRSVITLNITPTNAPDVYLLIGQSNMVGSSLDNARQSDTGEPDARNPRILQINVTGNDSTNFPTPASFNNRSNIVNLDAPVVEALDPLHDGFNFNINGKLNTQIGLGLSFAKAMLPNTSANIMLVPAAWSDTGFCKRDTNLFPGMGWHATPPADTVNFTGTLLHDRALARLNFALQQSGGIFRGILWHQGEADASNDVCAAAYQNNLTTMVESIRTNAAVDLRGQQARGAAADVPFIAGTMSIGGEFSVLTPAREVVDGVHRLVPSLIPFAATVLNDDLVPPTYPCGNGGCIHFGATAYREMGARYANSMLAVQRR